MVVRPSTCKGHHQKKDDGKIIAAKIVDTKRMKVRSTTKLDITKSMIVKS